MDRALNSAILFSANKGKGILAIGARPDDIELGCDTSLACLAQKGIYIAIVVMTTGNSGVDRIIDHYEESRDALEILGYHQTIHLSFADIRAHLQLSDMISTPENIIKNQILSDVGIIRVYTMHDADHHQDHFTVYRTSTAACRAIPQILGYEAPSTWLSFVPQVSESVKEEYFSLKPTASKRHKSQSQRDYMRPERLRAVVRFHGQQVSSDLGEGFVIHKMIL